MRTVIPWRANVNLTKSMRTARKKGRERKRDRKKKRVRRFAIRRPFNDNHIKWPDTIEAYFSYSRNKDVAPSFGGCGSIQFNQIRCPFGGGRGDTTGLPYVLYVAALHALVVKYYGLSFFPPFFSQSEWKNVSKLLYLFKNRGFFSEICNRGLFRVETERYVKSRGTNIRRVVFFN